MLRHQLEIVILKCKMLTWNIYQLYPFLALSRYSEHHIYIPSCVSSTGVSVASVPGCFTNRYRCLAPSRARPPSSGPSRPPSWHKNESHYPAAAGSTLQMVTITTNHRPHGHRGCWALHSQTLFCPCLLKLLTCLWEKREKIKPFRLNSVRKLNEMPMDMVVLDVGKLSCSSRACYLPVPIIDSHILYFIVKLRGRVRARSLKRLDINNIQSAV